VSASKPSGSILLREAREDDLPCFFEHQLDPAANRMAAFTREDPSNRVAFIEHWAKILGDDGVTTRTILLEDQVVGHIASFRRDGDLEVTYWIGRPFWGRGLASTALEQFLVEQRARPIYARAAQDNLASIRVLEKCGFVVCARERGFANARDKQIEEIILKLS